MWRAPKRYDEADEERQGMLNVLGHNRDEVNFVRN